MTGYKELTMQWEGKTDEARCTMCLDESERVALEEGAVTYKDVVDPAVRTDKIKSLVYKVRSYVATRRCVVVKAHFSDFPRYLCASHLRAMLAAVEGA